MNNIFKKIFFKEIQKNLKRIVNLKRELDSVNQRNFFISQKISKNKQTKKRSKDYKVIGFGSCLTRNSIKNFHTLGMFRYTRIDSINNYFLNGKKRENVKFYEKKCINSKKHVLSKQYFGLEAGAWSGVGKSFKDSEELLQCIRICDAIVVDTFFDQRAKLIKKNNSQEESVFLNSNFLINKDQVEIIPKLTINEIQREYLLFYEKIKKINPKCKIIVLNFTGLDYLEHFSKYLKLIRINRILKKIKKEDFYFISYQKLIKSDFYDYGGRFLLENHLQPELYQKYSELIEHIIKNVQNKRYFGPSALN